MKRWIIKFQENGDEYIGTLVVTANELTVVAENAFIADGVYIEMDEPIVSEEEIPL